MPFRAAFYAPFGVSGAKVWADVRLSPCRVAPLSLQQQIRHIVQPFGHQMHHRPLRCTRPSICIKPRANRDAPIAFKPVGPNDNIAGAGFIFQRQKHHTLGTARTLAANHQTGNAQCAPIGASCNTLKAVAHSRLPFAVAQKAMDDFSATIAKLA